MNRLILCVYLLLCNSLDSLAQMQWITNYLDSPVLIAWAGGTGSGFYLVHSNYAFLVTADHVLFDPKTGTLNTPQITCTSYQRASDATARYEIQLNLTNLIAANEIHRNTTHDIAIVRWGVVQPNGRMGTANQMVTVVTNPSPGFKFIPANSLRRMKDVKVGDDVYLFGYPTSLDARTLGLPIPTKFELDKPLLRKGIVAGKYEASKRIIIDATVYFGNSGGPVVELENGPMFEQNFNIVGIATDFMPFTDLSESARFHTVTVSQFNSGYAVVEPADFILDLLWF